MIILKEFFNELTNIQLLESSILNNTPQDNDETYNLYMQQRIDFQIKYARILRGIDLLTDYQYILLHDYFAGKIISGVNLAVDRKLIKLIYDVENAI